MTINGKPENTPERVLPGGKEEFFAEHYRLRYHKLYQPYLEKHIEPGEKGLSLASGLCINELLLREKGHDIVCSDVKDYWDRGIYRIFPDFKFEKMDALQFSLPEPVNYVIALALLYLFDEENALKFFKNVADNLKPGGHLYMDPSGAEDNFFTFLLDDVLCPADAFLQLCLKKAMGRRASLVKSRHGYRYKNEEIIALAGRAGLKLADLYIDDHVTELKDRLLLFNRLPDNIAAVFGRLMPYVRLFNFVKKS